VRHSRQEWRWRAPRDQLGDKRRGQSCSCVARGYPQAPLAPAPQSALLLLLNSRGGLKRAKPPGWGLAMCALSLFSSLSARAQPRPPAANDVTAHISIEYGSFCTFRTVTLRRLESHASSVNPPLSKGRFRHKCGDFGLIKPRGAGTDRGIS
jgi:hypothetical protein